MRIARPRSCDDSLSSRATADAVRRIGIKLSALAQGGLTYAADEYDRDRYRQVSRLAAELLSMLSGQPTDELAVEFGRDSGYATPKIDVRGAIFGDHERVLLMREKTDDRWSLPSGWADPGDAPSVAVTREILEETGYHSSAVKLIACWDRELQDNREPPGARIALQPGRPAGTRRRGHPHRVRRPPTIRTISPASNNGHDRAPGPAGRPE